MTQSTSWNKQDQNLNVRPPISQSNQDSRQNSGQKTSQQVTPVKIADQIPNATLRVNPIDMYADGVQSTGSSTSPNQFQPSGLQSNAFNQFN